jgi:hypothetical protein
MKIQEKPLSTLRNIDGGPLGGSNGDPVAHTINTKKCRRRATREVMSEIREHPPSTLKTSIADPLGGGAEDSGAPTISAEKHQWWAPWEVLTEIRERPSSTLRNVNDGPPRRRCQKS